MKIIVAIRGLCLSILAIRPLLLLVHKHLVDILSLMLYNQKYRLCNYASDKWCADFSLKMHKKHLATGLRPDPLGELAYNAPPDLLAVINR